MGCKFSAPQKPLRYDRLTHISVGSQLVVTGFVFTRYILSQQTALHLTCGLLERASVQIVAFCNVTTFRRNEAKQRIETAHPASSGDNAKWLTSEKYRPSDLDHQILGTPAAG